MQITNSARTDIDASVKIALSEIHDKNIQSDVRGCAWLRLFQISCFNMLEKEIRARLYDYWIADYIQMKETTYCQLMIRGKLLLLFRLSSEELPYIFLLRVAPLSRKHQLCTQGTSETKARGITWAGSRRRVLWVRCSKKGNVGGTAVVDGDSVWSAVRCAFRVSFFLTFILRTLCRK